MGSADGESKLRAVACRSAWPSLVVGEPLPLKLRLLNKVCHRPLSPGGRAYRGGLPMQGRISWATLCALFLAAVFVAAILHDHRLIPSARLATNGPRSMRCRTGNNRYYHPLLMIEVHAIRQSGRRRARSPGHCRGRAELARRLPAVSSFSPPIGWRGWCCPSSAPWRQRLRRRQRRSSPCMRAS